MSDFTKYALWFMLVFGTANSHIRDILDSYDTLEEAYGRLTGGTFEEESKEKGFKFSAKIQRELRTTPLEKCNMIIEYCRQKNIDIISIEDKGYPETLKNIESPPLCLFCEGNADLLQKPVAVSMVGTRKASDYSLKVAKCLAGDLAKDGFVVISGFAAGSDAACHDGAVEAGGETIAVIGCGTDVEYPKGSFKRKMNIIRSGGLIVSEYLPGTIPRRENFPVRNRIIAALGLGTIVVQAPEKSGALITANLALDMGKDIFCVPPHDIFDKTYAGVVKYLREGAVPVFSHLDVVNAYYFSYAYKFSAENIFKNIKYSDDKPQNAVKAKKIDTKSEDNIEKSSGAETENKIDLSSISDQTQKKIVEFLQKNGKMHVDEIGAAVGADFGDLLLALTNLEISKVIKQLPGNMYEIK